LKEQAQELLAAEDDNDENDKDDEDDPELGLVLPLPQSGQWGARTTQDPDFAGRVITEDAGRNVA